ncbi:MAG: PP2C family protein-serine/threonine phosphatase [Thermoleophilaceae bacterium]
MRAFERLYPRTTAARLAVIGALLAGIFAVRANVVIEPGPLVLIPLVLAAQWFGRIGGASAGLIAAGVYAGARAVEAPQDVANLMFATALRVVLYVAVGYMIGRLYEQRAMLSQMVASQARELVELREVQAALAPPEAPPRPSLELASVYVPAEEGAAGDFYLVAPGPGDTTVMVVGDVAGHGLSAAKRAAFVRTTLATSAPYTDNPCKLLSLANAALLERAEPTEELVTAACLVYAPSEHRVRWALAGHPAPMWLDCGTPLNGLRPSFPLGVEPELVCDIGEMSIEPGNGFLLFTDGLSEARRAGGELFGTDRITTLVSGLSGSSPSEVVSRLRSAAEEFSGGHLPDDLCVVAARAAAV